MRSYDTKRQSSLEIKGRDLVKCKAVEDNGRQRKSWKYRECHMNGFSLVWLR